MFALATNARFSASSILMKGSPNPAALTVLLQTEAQTTTTEMIFIRISAACYAFFLELKTTGGLGSMFTLS